MGTTIRLVTTVVLILIAGVPALAKGPSSATITGPGIDEPMELIDYDMQYRDLVVRLMELSGVWYGTAGLNPVADVAPARDLGPAYNLTWINSGDPGNPDDDYLIYQHLYLHAEGGPVIHTPEQAGMDPYWEKGQIGWRVATPELTNTLRGLGVPVDSVSAISPGVHPVWLSLGTLAVIPAAVRFVNSRLRPVVSNT